jgi:F-type H+-transporting ATPase subunit b
LLRRRQEKIQNNLDSAEKEKKDAEALKREYNGKLANAEKESEEILSESRKKALKKDAEIVDEAKEEAARILKRAEREAELEKNKVRDDVKTEMIQVAAAMAGKFVTASLDETKQDQLIAETLQEMGSTTWNTDNVEQETT